MKSRKVTPFLALLVAAWFAVGCERTETPTEPEAQQTVEEAVPSELPAPTFNSLNLPSGGGSGAIFTTTPDGGIVNENVRYEGRQEVYLDGGPKQNAPVHAAGLDEGFYVFQITDPPGKMLLSRDPARCRIVYVSPDGVITKLMAPSDNSFKPTFGGMTVAEYIAGQMNGKALAGDVTDNWAEKGQYSGEPCHVPGPLPDSEAGTYAPTPDITGVGRHDTNPDVDHGGDFDAIVVQMMPYGLTPNPGGVYKAWMTPIDAYVSVKGANLNDIPTQLPANKQKPHPCYDFCADEDPGFAPSHRYTKTDNFKVTEKFPAEIKVRKFHDLNGDGLWDMAKEPEIGKDQCVDLSGNIVACPGGWPYDFTFPLNGGTKTELFFTPYTHVVAVAGTYSAEEYFLSGWFQTASWLDGNYDVTPQKKVDVQVLASGPGETHEIWFGNTRPGKITGKKVIDYNGNGEIDSGDICDSSDATNHPGCYNIKVTISGTSNFSGPITPYTVLTKSDGTFEFTGLEPGTYKVEIKAADEYGDFVCTYPTDNYGDNTCSYPNIVINSGDSVDLNGVHTGAAAFGDFLPPRFVRGLKFIDANGNGKWDKGEGEDCPTDNTGCAGVKVTLQKWDGSKWVDEDTTFTDSNGFFSFENLAAGKYRAIIAGVDEPAGFVCTAYEGSDPCSTLGFELGSGDVVGADDGLWLGDFEKGKVTACKFRQSPGSPTPSKDSPIAGWPVYLTIDDVKQSPVQYTGENGCYTWTDLGPLPKDSYYDTAEGSKDGWVTVGAFDNDGTFIAYATQIDFDGELVNGYNPSGFAYKAEFVNTPTQGCTPGFWQGGPDPSADVGGATLWNELGAFDGGPADPEWVASGGAGMNPYNHDDVFTDFFGLNAYCTSSVGTMFDRVSTGGGSDDCEKAARSMVAAYLNASWGMAYGYTTAEIQAMWTNASTQAQVAQVHIDLDKANNAPEGCPIDATPYK